MEGENKDIRPVGQEVISEHFWTSPGFQKSQKGCATPFAWA